MTQTNNTPLIDNLEYLKLRFIKEHYEKCSQEALVSALLTSITSHNSSKVRRTSGMTPWWLVASSLPDFPS